MNVQGPQGEVQVKIDYEVSDLIHFLDSLHPERHDLLDRRVEHSLQPIIRIFTLSRPPLLISS